MSENPVPPVNPNKVDYANMLKDDVPYIMARLGAYAGTTIHGNAPTDIDLNEMEKAVDVLEKLQTVFLRNEEFLAKTKVRPNL